GRRYRGLRAAGGGFRQAAGTGSCGLPRRVLERSAGEGRRDQPWAGSTGGGAGDDDCAGGPRSITSTSGSFQGPVTLYVRAAISPSGLRSTTLAAAPIAAPTGPAAIAPTAVSRLP